MQNTDTSHRETSGLDRPPHKRAWRNICLLAIGEVVDGRKQDD